MLAMNKLSGLRVMGAPGITQKLLSSHSGVLGTAVLLGCSLVALSGGPARAADLECNTVYAYGDFNVGDVFRVGCLDKELTINAFSGLDAGDTIQFLSPLGTGREEWKFDMNFVPSLQGAIAGSFDYDVLVTDPRKLISNVSLASDGTGGATVVKTVSSPVDTEVARLISVDGSDAAAFLGYERIYVNDSWTVPVDGALGNLSNTYFQCDGPCDPVPGPLPILGLGATFGWSRRLRNRIKLRKLPEGIGAMG